MLARCLTRPRRVWSLDLLAIHKDFVHPLLEERDEDRDQAGAFARPKSSPPGVDAGASRRLRAGGHSALLGVTRGVRGNYGERSCP